MLWFELRTMACRDTFFKAGLANTFIASIGKPTRKLVSDDFGRGFLLLLQFIHRCEKVKMISEQT